MFDFRVFRAGAVSRQMGETEFLWNKAGKFLTMEPKPETQARKNTGARNRANKQSKKST